MHIEQLGPYRIGRKLGKGGMGSVFEAVDVKTNQRVAVKVLSPQLAAADGFRERFEAEIESLKKLQHEGIVRLYGYGEHEGVLYYSMELIDGPSLEQEINAGRRFDWQETLSLAIQVCRALKHAHDHGVVHRDIKPANLLLTDDDRVKIADFGIARLFGATQLTNAGGVLGTADYMSPEQADGRAITEKCDQYSLGCVMFATLAGRPPFRAKTMPEMLQLQRFAEPEPVRRFASDTPEQLDRLILQLLSKEPAERFPNVLVLARHMEAMQKAMSRPGNPGAAGGRSADNAAEELGATAVYGVDATLAPKEPSLAPLETTDSDVFDAPTVADDAAGPPVGKASMPARLPASTPQTAPRTTSAAPRASRFTTVDEDAERRARQDAAPRWLLGAQSAAFTAVLAMLGWGAWQLTRPDSADGLFSAISKQVEQDGDADLRPVSEEIEEFLERFPDDGRAAEVRTYADELELQRLERQLRTRAKLGAGKEAQTISNILSAAMALQPSDPSRAAAMLENLLTIYPRDGAAAEGVSAQQQAYLTLAERQLAKLRLEFNDRADALLPDLEERLLAARRLEKSSPAEAAAIYSALVELFQSEPWAAPIVEQARSQLQSITARPAGKD